MHPPLDSHPQAQYMCIIQFKTEKKGICLPLPINQSTPALGSTILPQSSSDLDTDQGGIIDEMIKQVVQTVNQTLLKTTTGSPTSNLDSSNTSHHNTPGRKSVPTLNTSDVHKHTISPKHTYRPDSSENSLTHPVTNFEQTKQIIIEVYALSHLPTLHNKILQGLNINGLCQYNNTHQDQAYLFKPSS